MIQLALVGLIAAPSTQVDAFPDARAMLENPVVADPDEPRFSYGATGGRHRSSFGGRLGLVGFRVRDHRVAVSLAPLFELANVGAAPVSWQTFRANVGLDVSWRPPLAQNRGLVLHMGFFHESDHVADIATYSAMFLADPRNSFDNGNFSSFEYVKARFDFSQHWRVDHVPALALLVSPGIRVFTPNLNRADTRGDLAALQNEVRLELGWRPHLSTWIAAYGEVGFRSLDDGSRYRDPHHGPAWTRRILLGLTTHGAGPSLFVFQAGYDNSTGRGVDFMRTWGHALSLEVAIHR